MHDLLYDLQKEFTFVGGTHCTHPRTFQKGSDLRETCLCSWFVYLFVKKFCEFFIQTLNNIFRVVLGDVPYFSSMETCIAISNQTFIIIVNFHLLAIELFCQDSIRDLQLKR